MRIRNGVMSESEGAVPTGNTITQPENSVGTDYDYEADSPGEHDVFIPEAPERHDDRSEHVDSHTGSEAEDERLIEAEANDDEETATERAAREKESSRSRRERRKARERKLLEENEYMRKQLSLTNSQLADTASRVIDSQIMGIDTKIQECLNDVRQAENIEAQAISAQNGADVIKARQIQEAARRAAQQLEMEKQRLSVQRNQPLPQVPPPGAAEIRKLGLDFAKDKRWLSYDGQGRPLNRESAIASAHEQALHEEGRLDPTTREFWQELDKRVKTAMPALFRNRSNAEDDDMADDNDDYEEERPTRQRQPEAKSRQRGPAVGGSGRQGNAGKGWTLSAVRVAAIKEAGNWDDPKARDRAIKYYQTYDRNQRKS